MHERKIIGENFPGTLQPYVWYASAQCLRNKPLLLWHKTAAWAALTNNPVGPPSHCIWGFSRESLAKRQGHAPNVSPSVESLTDFGIKKIIIKKKGVGLFPGPCGYSPNVKKWPQDLEASLISQGAFHISKSSHRTSSLTPWSWLNFLSLGLPGFCLWSLNLGAVICQPR